MLPDEEVDKEFEAWWETYYHKSTQGFKYKYPRLNLKYVAFEAWKAGRTHLKHSLITYFAEEFLNPPTK